MKIGDMIVCIPASFLVVLKTIRVKADEQTKKEILKNGLYHITTSEKVLDQIVESQHLRPATGLAKNINSYGKAAVCFFNGIPNINDYMHNLNKSPYIKPQMVEPALKIMPKKKEELSNYKIRALIDNAVLFEGYCILKSDEIEKVFLVPDLVRDDNGVPIVNTKTNRYDIAFREANDKELSNDRKSYEAKEDYLEFIKEERKRLGYLERDSAIGKTKNFFEYVSEAIYGMGEEAVKNIIKNVPKILKQKFKSIFIPKLEAPVDERINENISEFDTSKKNPYREEKFAKSVISFMEEGLYQLELKDELENLTTSKNGEFFRSKFYQINENRNGESHNNRVALLSMIIAQNEGILENDFGNRTKDLLLSSAYYEELKQRNGSKTLLKNKILYENGKEYSDSDKRILQAIFEARRKKDKKFSKICKKYNIEDQEYAIKLMEILKDADALDRVRLDVNLPFVVKTNLDAKYLRTDTAKKLINISYQLENLTKKFQFNRIISYKTSAQQKGGLLKNKREKFMEGLQQSGINQVTEKIPKLKEKLTLCKKKITRLYGKSVKRIMMMENNEDIKREGEER